MLRISNCVFAVLLLVAGGTVVQADIVYNIADYSTLQSGWTLSGTITTDGVTNKYLAQSDIKSWSVTITQGSTAYNFSSDSSGSYIVLQNQIFASATQITVATPAGNAGTVNDLELGTSSSEIQWHRLSASAFRGTTYPPEDFYLAYSGSTNFWDTSAVVGGDPNGLTLGSETNWVIASTAAVPEPSSLVMVAIAGVGGLIVHARRRGSKLSRPAGALV